MGSVTNVLIFKTDIQSTEDVKTVNTVLKRMKNIEEFSVDIADCDKVLRVVSCGLAEDDIIQVVSEIGYQCCVLP